MSSSISGTPGTLDVQKTLSSTTPLSGNAFLDGIAARPMILVWLLGASIAVGAAWVGIINQRESKANAANNALFQAEKSIDQEAKAMITVPATDDKTGAKSSPESVQFKKVDVDTKFSASVSKLKNVIEQYSGTRAAFEATMKLGSLYQEHGESAKAVPWFEKSVAAAPRNLDRELAQASLGYAQEGAGKFKEAIDAFKNAISLQQQSDPDLRGELLLSIARNQELMGDKAAARMSYDQTISQSPNTEQARMAELLKAQL